MSTKPLEQVFFKSIIIIYFEYFNRSSIGINHIYDARVNIILFPESVQTKKEVEMNIFTSIQCIGNKNHIRNEITGWKNHNSELYLWNNVFAIEFHSIYSWHLSVCQYQLRSACCLQAIQILLCAHNFIHQLAIHYWLYIVHSTLVDKSFLFRVHRVSGIFTTVF